MAVGVGTDNGACGFYFVLLNFFKKMGRRFLHTGRTFCELFVKSNSIIRK